jgi:hypothetical protein
MVHDWNVLQAELALASGAEIGAPLGILLLVLRCGRPGRRWGCGAIKLADLLGYLASADNWYDVYKAFEVVEAMVGGQHKLEAMLGPDAKVYEVARQSSNFYRHARTSRPADLISREEARTRLVHVVRTIAARFLGSE